MNEANPIRDQALALTPVERAGLIEDLLTSFDPASRAKVDQAWAQEAEERIEAFEKGEMGAISLDESKRRIGNR